MFSTLRRLSTVSRRPRSKKKILDFDKDIELFSDKESGDGAASGTSGYVRFYYPDKSVDAILIIFMFSVELTHGVWALMILRDLRGPPMVSYIKLRVIKMLF